MIQNNPAIVITLVTPNKNLYKEYNLKIKNILKNYNINGYKTNKLSNFVKDYFFSCSNSHYLNIKKTINYLSEDVDICIQHKKYRRKNILACDMDMTVINTESINLINQMLLKRNEISKLTEKAMNGEISFKNSIIKRTKMLRGLTESDIKKIIKKIKINKGVKSVIRTMNNSGNHTMLISGGYDIIAKVIGKEIGFKEIVCNSLEIKNQKLTGNLSNEIIDKIGKLNYFKKRVISLNISNKRTLAVGDGDNDIDMVRYASLGVAWRAYPKLKKNSDTIISRNFKSLLYFQGYNEKNISSRL